jgi:class 3 adenylate cyclase/basic membrane lipoprotein Med (substrate-binding protein (PBP1-ABC) superfamily)
LIFSSSAGLLDEIAYAVEYPNISFVRAAGPVLSGENLPPNLAEHSIDWFDAAFVLGAVAGAVSNTCAGFISAFEHRQSTWGHAMGFALGYQWVKPQQPIHLITMDSYFNPEAEVMAARQLVEQTNCDVIGRHTDPNDVDRYVYDLGGHVLSMARYVDMSTFVGDTVFTSQVWDPFQVMSPILEDAFLTRLDGRLGNFTNFTHGRPGPMRLSPFTSAVNQSLARIVAEAAWKHINTTNPLCGQKWRANGEPLVVVPAAADDGNDPASLSCLRYATMDLPVSYLDLPNNVTYYDSFQDGGVVCGPGGKGGTGGKFFRYNANFSVSCFLCPANTYQGNDQRAAESCLPCPVGTTAVAGSAQCTSIPGVNTVLITVVTCTTSIVMLFMILLAVRSTRRRDNTYAPKQAHKVPIAVMFTDIQASTTLWAHIPEEMAKAVDAHNFLLRTVIRKYKGYEVKTIGDAFMVVHADIAKAVAMATEIQQVLHMFDWGTTKIDQVYADIAKKMKKQQQPSTGNTNNNEHGETHNATSTGDTSADDLAAAAAAGKAAVWNGLRVRVGIAYGMCDGHKDPVTAGWDYFGTTVNTSARVESVAHGGQVLITAPAYQALLMSSNSRTGGGGGGKSSRLLAEAAMSCQDVVSNGVRTTLRSESARNNARWGISLVLTHGAVFLRGLSERVGLVEVVTVGLEDRRFPPLRIEQHEPELGADQNQMDIDSMSCDISNHCSLDGADLLALTPELRLDRLMKLSMRAAGVRRCDAELLQSTWGIYHSLKAVLSLNSLEERDKILERLIRKWHLSFPKLSRKILDAVGSDTPKLLMLSIRAATVVLADRRQSYLAFDSGLPREIGVLAGIQEDDNHKEFDDSMSMENNEKPTHMDDTEHRDETTDETTFHNDLVNEHFSWEGVLNTSGNGDLPPSKGDF